MVSYPNSTMTRGPPSFLENQPLFDFCKRLVEEKISSPKTRKSVPNESLALSGLVFPKSPTSHPAAFQAAPHPRAVDKGSQWSFTVELWPDPESKWGRSRWTRTSVSRLYRRRGARGRQAPRAGPADAVRPRKGQGGGGPSPPAGAGRPPRRCPPGLRRPLRR